MKRMILESVALSLLLFLLFSVFYNSREDRKLRKENRMYEKIYPEMDSREKLLAAVTSGLQERDNRIYMGLFNTESPTIDPITAADAIVASDSLSEEFFLGYSSSKIDNVMKMADNVDEDFRAIFDALCDRRDSIPPLRIPLENMSYSRTGASIGNKINPLMKVEVFHSGIDLVARQGETVYAAADGVVSNVVRSSAGLGNIVEIDHGNGYVSRYALLGDNIPVSRGMRIKAGRKIGYVGISRGSFAPHLHYEILFKGEVLDPVNYLFASISPDEYANMLFMSVSPGQSLD